MVDLLTLSEAARVAYVSRETIRYWIKTGRLAVTKGPPSARSGRPYNTFVTRADLLKASPNWRDRELRASNGHLMTVAELADTLDMNLYSTYKLIARYQLEKIYITGNSYLIDGSQVAEGMSDDPTYYHLLRRPVTGILL
tara:strand:- start:6287 stop:6706 length:420 start_codon:yes stop_codon:yes gene_type:complete